ncbi:YfbU family protein [Stenotrophomonas maltophilia]|uniref:YfbU family protein n=1 Tax=Stenotrophomonas maltophilia TaxID=40324 RepID=UPI0009A143D7|nr:YfbU family protein [Stenotrophomonas maltophilia]
MELSKKDRVLLINQYRILSHLDESEAGRYQELIEILENGYTIFYSMIDSWVDDEMGLEDGRFVLNVLDLYRAMEDLKRRSKDSRILDHGFSYFRGFDGNGETQYMAFCRFLVEVQGKFQEQRSYLLKNDNFNSHLPMRDKYMRMLAAAKRIPSIWEMSVDEALTILNA